MTKPRDYRDDGDLDDALDCIRVATRSAARDLFRTCLDLAYTQGRTDMLDKVLRDRGHGDDQTRDI